MTVYRRILLKLSGETLAPENGDGCFDGARADEAARVIGQLRDLGAQVGVVIGGGNIWRGRNGQGMNPVNADQMGMLATIMNALCLGDALERAGIPHEVFSAQEMNRFTRLYTARDALACLERGDIALLSGGTGNPFFTTDSGAALRAAELRCDALFKVTTVDGVFDGDPNKDPSCHLLPDLTYAQCIEKGYRVMDRTAFELCQARGVGVLRVFSMKEPDSILRVAQGDRMGTTVHR